MFNGLDLIDQAIGDVTATSAVLDEILANMSEGDDKHEAIAHLFRHLQTDLATLQRANAEARAAILRPRASGVAMSTVPHRAVLVAAIGKACHSVPSRWQARPLAFVTNQPPVEGAWPPRQWAFVCAPCNNKCSLCEAGRPVNSREAD